MVFDTRKMARMVGIELRETKKENWLDPDPAYWPVDKGQS